ncbi:MAG: hypothetical protein ACXWWC_13385 [Chitinophagaceae bacterium]
MTHRQRSWLVIAFFSLISIFSFAQFRSSQQEKGPKFPGWVSDKGYWVIESNINTPRNHVVCFFNNNNELLYKETLTGVKLNPDKRKIKMKLKIVLESSVLAWKNKKEGLLPSEDLALVKSIL